MGSVLPVYQEIAKLLQLHKQRFDYRMGLKDKGCELDKDTVKMLHTMSEEEFENVQQMTEFVVDSGKFDAAAITAAFAEQNQNGLQRRGLR